MKPAYKVVVDPLATDVHPKIVKADLADVTGVSWREAKKQLRKWYMDGASAVRAMREPK